MTTLTLLFPCDFPQESLAGDSRTLDADAHGGDYHWILGRRPDCDVVISHRMVSGRHAAIRFSNLLQRWELIDLNSSNGTWLNGRRIEPEDPEPIEYQDRFYLGNPECEIILTQGEEDTVENYEEDTIIQNSTHIPPVLAPKTYGDAAYAFVSWVAAADTVLGGLFRLGVVAVVSAAAVIAVAVLRG